MKVVSKGIIPCSNVDFGSSTFPCIIVLPSGRWLATFRSAPLKGDCHIMKAVLTWSDDEGKTWKPPFEPVSLPKVGSKTGQSRVSYLMSLGGKRILMVTNWVDSTDTSIPYYDPINQTLKDTYIFHSISEDEGQSWSRPLLMNTSPAAEPTPLTGPPMMLKNGSIFCQFEINKRIGDKSEWIHKSAFIFSYDQGKSWKDITIITKDPTVFYWDQRPSILMDGKTILNYFWTFDNKNNEYKNIHSKVSKDGGKSWSKISDTGIDGQPGQPADIGGKGIVTVDINRKTIPIITLRITQDKGQTYTENFILYESNSDQGVNQELSLNEAWDEMLRYSVGHPNLIRLNTNEILAYFYAGSHFDNTNIYFIRMEI